MFTNFPALEEKQRATEEWKNNYYNDDNKVSGASSLRINLTYSSAVFLATLQLLSDSQINMVKVVNSVSDALNAMQKENVGLKARVKADLQRAPVRGARLKGCSNGKTLFLFHFMPRLIFKLVSSLCITLNIYWPFTFRLNTIIFSFRLSGGAWCAFHGPIPDLSFFN